MERLEAHRRFLANLIFANAGVAKGSERLIDAVAGTPREKYVGPGPWKIFTASGYIETPTDDPALLYQDVVVALAPERKINNGQPVLHAICLAALGIKEGESVVHVGAGTGYYTEVLARLVGATGRVTAYETEQDLAKRAEGNLGEFSNVKVKNRSGAAGLLPECDVIYVSAGATAPLENWVDALLANGRLLFPLTPAEGPGGAPSAGGMLLVTRLEGKRFAARFVCPAAFVPCAGARDDETAAKLTAAFRQGNWRDVKSLRRGTDPDESCWVAGKGWWLSAKDEAREQAA